MLIKSPQKVKDKRNIESDALLAIIQGKTAEEIEAYFDNNVSAIARSTDAQIDAYVDAIGSVAEVKVALKIIAKDSAFNSKMLKKLTKLIVLLSDKVL